MKCLPLYQLYGLSKVASHLCKMTCIGCINRTQVQFIQCICLFILKSVFAEDIQTLFRNFYILFQLLIVAKILACYLLYCVHADHFGRVTTLNLFVAFNRSKSIIIWNILSIFDIYIYYYLLFYILSICVYLCSSD